MKHLKGTSARRINHVRRRTGTLWAREYFDRYIRNEDHFRTALRYLVQNPVQARLTTTLMTWPGTWLSTNMSLFLSE